MTALHLAATQGQLQLLEPGVRDLKLQAVISGTKTEKAA